MMIIIEVVTCKAGSKTDLSRVKNRENVNESFVQRRQKTKQPRESQKGNHHHACFDANSARRQNYWQMASRISSFAATLLISSM